MRQAGDGSGVLHCGRVIGCDWSDERAFEWMLWGKYACVMWAEMQTVHWANVLGKNRGVCRCDPKQEFSGRDLIGESRTLDCCRFFHGLSIYPCNRFTLLECTTWIN